MQIDKSVTNFMNDPKNYLLNVKSTKDGQKILTADKKGVLTWIKAHFPGNFFGNYNLKNVAASLDNKVSPELRNAVNSVIIKYKLVHSNTDIQILKNEHTKISKNQIIEIATQTFANHELKETILKEINIYLRSYDDSLNSKTYYIGLSGPHLDISDDERKINDKVDDEVISFFCNNKFPGIEVSILE